MSRCCDGSYRTATENMVQRPEIVVQLYACDQEMGQE